MRIRNIKEVDYDGYIYTPQVQDNENYLFENRCLSKNCQNAGASTTQKVLTRVGENCKVVVLGSLNQIDSKYLTKFNNGLSALLDEAANGNVDSDVNMVAITLTKTKRSAMCDFAEKLFTGRK